jgi:hypothetical protein
MSLVRHHRALVSLILFPDNQPGVRTHSFQVLVTRARREDRPEAPGVLTPSSSAADESGSLGARTSYGEVNGGNGQSSSGVQGKSDAQAQVGGSAVADVAGAGNRMEQEGAGEMDDVTEEEFTIRETMHVRYGDLIVPDKEEEELRVSVGVWD